MVTGKPAPPNWVDIADLEAQQAMVRVAEQMLALTYWQIGLSIVGAFALLWTIRETRRASSAAFASVAAQQEAQRAVLIVKQSRAWIQDNWDLYAGAANRPAARYGGRAEITFKNVGASLALVRRSQPQVFFGAALPPVPIYTRPGETAEHRPLDAGQSFDERASWKGNISDEESASFERGEASLWLYGIVEYDDIFGRRHRFGYCYRFAHDRRQEEAGGDAYWRPRVAKGPNVVDRLVQWLNPVPKGV